MIPSLFGIIGFLCYPQYPVSYIHLFVSYLQYQAYGVIHNCG